MSKKLLSFILVLVLILAALAGCAKRSGGRTETAPVKKEPVETGGVPSGLPETDGPEPEPDGDISPALWRVTDGERTLYLLGTIHVGDSRSDGALAAVGDLFDKCDALAVEFDIVAFENDLTSAINEIQQFLYTDGTTVRDHITEDLYERSLEIIKSGGDYSPLLERYNLAIWEQTLDQALIKPSGLSPDYGMDGLLLDRAYERGMEILEVESAHFQYGLMNGFPEELYVLLIEDTVDNSDEYQADLQEMYETWLRGDTDALEEFILGSEDEQEQDLTDDQIALIEEYNRKMGEERNLGMADKAESYLKSGKTVFFAVGAAHMLGDAGLVKLLTDKGYEVTRVEPPYLPTNNA